MDRVTQVLLALGTAVALWYGMTRVRDGSISPGDLLVFTAYLSRRSQACAQDGLDDRTGRQGDGKWRAAFGDLRSVTGRGQTRRRR